MSKQQNGDDRAGILIVDDRPDKVLSLEVVLEELGQRIVRAYSGREALRQVLNDEFAVILLDVNMPDMDGFETASLIRQRRSSLHTPIIFVTSFGDEMHAARGYSLGAVDYILAPVLPDVLRTKVGVFVDLFRKTRQLRRQAQALGRRAAQQQRLAAAAVAMNGGAASTVAMLQTVADAARDVFGTREATSILFGDVAVRAGSPPGHAFGAVSPARATEDAPPQFAALTRTTAARDGIVTRLAGADLHGHADSQALRDAGFSVDLAGDGGAGGMLSAPLVGRDGETFGAIFCWEPAGGGSVDFARDDEAVLVQLAQMASIAVENELYARESEANRLKDEFLATLSHELRTPLSAILGWSQLLRRRELTKDVGHGLEVIERNVRSQLKLIEDLLDVSRITAGKVRLQSREIALGAIVAAAVDAIRPVADDRQVAVSLDAKGASRDAVFGDAERLQQVIWNLLSNAVKFTPAGGNVVLSVTSDAAYVTVAVTDSGCGIHPSFLPYVFDRFRQADSSSTRSHGGLGIGLAIVKHLVQLHGGSVEASSAGEGSGATFRIRLPLLVTAVRTAPASAAPADRDGEAARHQATPSLSGSRVLLVEDVPDSREMLASVLRDAGADVVAVGSAADAIEAFAAGPPDVMVSDIGMPELDGHGLINRIRSLPPERGGCTPAVALTAYVRDEDRLRILASGFQAHVAKPVEPDVLVRAVAAYLPTSQPA